MEISSVVIEHGFDKEMLEQIDSLRMIRLNLAEKMLKDLDATAAALKERGLIDAAETEELRQEATDRVKTLKARMGRPDVVWADEVSLYVDLLESGVEDEL